MFHLHRVRQLTKSIYPVENIIRARVDSLDHDVSVEKIGGDHVWHKGRAFFLEHNGHNVISYVPLSLQLKHIQQRGNSDS